VLIDASGATAAPFTYEPNILDNASARRDASISWKAVNQVRLNAPRDPMNGHTDRLYAGDDLVALLFPERAQPRGQTLGSGVRKMVGDFIHAITPL
jgi:hypothetical protein